MFKSENDNGSCNDVNQHIDSDIHKIVQFHKVFMFLSVNFFIAVKRKYGDGFVIRVT